MEVVKKKEEERKKNKKQKHDGKIMKKQNSKINVDNTNQYNYSNVT